MAKTIIVTRHAHACMEYDGNDFSRPLASEGVKKQQKMNEVFKEKGYVADQILCSPFLRTQQTAKLMQAAFHCPCDVEPILGEEFDASKLLRRLQAMEDNKTVFLVGHEPTMHSFITFLVGRECLPGGLSRCGAVVIEFSGDVEFGKGKFVMYLRP